MKKYLGRKSQREILRRQGKSDKLKTTKQEDIKSARTKLIRAKNDLVNRGIIESTDALESMIKSLGSSDKNVRNDSYETLVKMHDDFNMNFSDVAKTLGKTDLKSLSPTKLNDRRFSKKVDRFQASVNESKESIQKIDKEDDYSFRKKNDKVTKRARSAYNATYAGLNNSFNKSLSKFGKITKELINLMIKIKGTSWIMGKLTQTGSYKLEYVYASERVNDTTNIETSETLEYLEIDQLLHFAYMKEDKSDFIRGYELLKQLNHYDYIGVLNEFKDRYNREMFTDEQE